MEAALRTAYALVMGKNPEPDAFKNVRGRKGWKEATFNLGDQELRVAVASGLGNTRRLIEALRKGEVNYHFVEIMACPGGCAGLSLIPVSASTPMRTMASGRSFARASMSMPPSCEQITRWRLWERSSRIEK